MLLILLAGRDTHFRSRWKFPALWEFLLILEFSSVGDSHGDLGVELLAEIWEYDSFDIEIGVSGFDNGREIVVFSRDWLLTVEILSPCLSIINKTKEIEF